MTPDLSLRFATAEPASLRRSGEVARGRPGSVQQNRHDAPDEVRIGIIRNGKARRNKSRYGLQVPPGGEWAMPNSFDELRGALALFARNGVNALVINGGDGTIRDVLTAAVQCFERMPRVAVIPSGKTNALAHDLGIPGDWTEDDAIRALRSGRLVERSPVEIRRPGARGAELQGFLVGAGNFVPATELAQKTHRMGAFNGVAIGLSVAGSIAQSLFGGGDNPWRRGVPMQVTLCGGVSLDGDKYLLLASTLERLPLGIRPFGRPRPGLKLLTVDAPPRRLALAVPAVLGGFALPDGYRRDDTDAVELVVEGDIIVDGEPYPGGALTLVRGTPIAFAVP